MANTAEPMSSTAISQPPGKKPDSQQGKMSLPEANNQPHRAHRFRLLDLPAELVVRVVQHAVMVSTYEEPLDLDPLEKQSYKQASITRACRLFRTEGLPLFYKHNFFFAETRRMPAQELLNWLQSIGFANASNIQHLHISWYLPYPLSDRSIQSFEQNLKKLTWRDFLHEMKFLRDVARIAKIAVDILEHIHIGRRGGKTLMGQGRYQGCYKLSFGQAADMRHDWERVLDFAEIDEDKLTAAEGDSKDFWIRDDESHE